MSVVRDLGVLPDSELSLQPHINKLASACFYYLRRLRQMRFMLDQAVMQRLASAFIFSRLDYCNSVLSGLPACTIAPLQRVMNAAVRLIAKLGTHDHVTDTMRQLNWLHIAWRVVYKDHKMACLCTAPQQVAAHIRLLLLLLLLMYCAHVVHITCKYTSIYTQTT
jgi:hypothetical protein